MGRGDAMHGGFAMTDDTQPATAGRGSATGAVAAGFHEGSRSEVLADYLFSAWGTVTPARRQSDYGLDLYCTLTERVGQLARVREYFSVQVKSEGSATWKFNDPDSVKWLIEHPVPLFLCAVDKKGGLVRVYHTIPRFQIWALGTNPERVELVAGNGPDGQFDVCANLPTCSLSAPILEINLADLADDACMKQLRRVFERWVQLDRYNCELVRAGLLRFHRPSSYRTNERPSIDSKIDLLYANDHILKRGILRLAEALECIGGQLAHPNQAKLLPALEAALLLDQLQKDFPNAFDGNRWWERRVPGGMTTHVVQRLLVAHTGGTGYLYSGLDAVEATLANIPLVQKYLER
jgi:hypothetical protein